MNELSFFDQKTIQLCHFAIIGGLLQLSFSMFRGLYILLSGMGLFVSGDRFIRRLGPKTKRNKINVERGKLF